MSKINEIETRSFISEETYISLCAAYLRAHPATPFIDMDNIYLDSEASDLADHDCFLRLRTTDASVELSLKILLSEMESEEYTQAIDVLTKSDLLDNHILPEGEIKEALKEKDLSMITFTKKGEMHTKRFEIVEEDAKIVIDSNSYLVEEEEVKDYDIEVECPEKEKALDLLKKISTNFGFEISKEYKTKYQRATL
ncbi:MAG: CYTH domain-containing protein [Coprobacillus sp.]|nr:CYTH domain-containing protein [Coprobacillus sp.]